LQKGGAVLVGASPGRAVQGAADRCLRYALAHQELDRILAASVASHAETGIDDGGEGTI
jgi:hypothetical protein